MGKVLTIIICIVAALCAFTGCNTAGCTDNQSSLPLVGFYSSDGTSITINSVDISGVGAPGDSILYTSGTSLSTVYLPLRSNATSTAYCFHYTQEGLDNPALNDTIRFDYTSKPYFASEECGAMLTYHVDKLTNTTHIIKEVTLVDADITNTDIERVKIYFKTE